MPFRKSRAWTAAALAAGLVFGAGFALAQTFQGEPLQSSRPIAIINQNGGVKLHRVLDEEQGVACYVLSDGHSAPSCVSVRPAVSR